MAIHLTSSLLLNDLLLLLLVVIFGHWSLVFRNFVVLSSVLVPEGVVVREAEVLVGADPVLDDVVCGRVDHGLVGLSATLIRALTSVWRYDLGTNDKF